MAFTSVAGMARITRIVLEPYMNPALAQRNTGNVTQFPVYPGVRDLFIAADRDLCRTERLPRHGNSWCY